MPATAPVSAKLAAEKPTTGALAKETLPAKKATTGAGDMAKPSFAGLFSTNRKRSDENRLTKFVVELETLELGADDLIDVQIKLGYWLVSYIAGKFPGLQAIRVLSKQWGSSFQLHDSGCLIFRFAQDGNRERVLASGSSMFGPSFHRSLSSVGIPTLSEKISSRLGMPVAMDSLTMKIDRVSYARILVEVDASKPLVDPVDFILPNGVMRSQPVVYEFTPKICKKCNRFGHLEGSCQDALLPAAKIAACC
ncbi:UNVERIFIED_CONTAM: hypothetical protein Sangu_0209900 [Sesamum angustifolium]|uniref:CCHC-type domain-containing protein n=1 Tax=Sesamum angustifolium TaxID=2727405 RepID=A0AAW2RMP7_9LAMI